MNLTISCFKMRSDLHRMAVKCHGHMEVAVTSFGLASVHGLWCDPCRLGASLLVVGVLVAVFS
jgi:hypothetical protein